MPRFDDPRLVAWLRRAAVGVLVLGFLACAGEAGSGPADPTLLPPGETQGPVTSVAGAGGPDGVERVPLPGFEDVVVEIERVDGEVVSWCLLLAATSEQHQRGLMEVTDPALGGHDGMLFRFAEDRTGGFWMRNTPLPLEIAYVDAAGATVSTATMEPCGDTSDCPSYAPAGAYRYAVEVPVEAGGIGRLGLPDGRLVDTGRPCSSG